MEDFLWTEKYRPKTVEDTILPKRYKDAFNQFVAQGNMPNLILSGSSGVGKTTIAKAVTDELGAQVLILNGSLDGTKDTLRTDITDFATSMSLDGGRKYVILDEADGLTIQMQNALRAFMEDYSKNCGFILTGNLPHKIIDAIHSRCSLIEFKLKKEERQDLLKETVLRLFDILNKEGVEYDKKVVVQFANKHFPDIRQMISVLQTFAAGGKIDASLLTDFDETSLKNLLKAIRAKNFDAMRKWVADSDIDQHDVYAKLYEVSRDVCASPDDIAALVVLLGEYQYKAAFAVNPDINLAAALVEMSATIAWKED